MNSNHHHHLLFPCLPSTQFLQQHQQAFFAWIVLAHAGSFVSTHIIDQQCLPSPRKQHILNKP